MDLFPVDLVVEGEASYYSEEESGTHTASGEVFDDTKLTCAMLTGDFGERYLVVSDDGFVIVRLNDRGPYVKGRILDLSLQAAKDIGLIKSGVTKVQIKIIKLGSDG